MAQGVAGGQAEDPAVVEATWREEIGRRIDDYLGGNKNLVGIEQSHAKVRAELSTSPLTRE